MAPQPKRKHSARRARVRGESLRLQLAQLTMCPSCKHLIRPHTVCPYCGYYDGRMVVAMKDTEEKRGKAKTSDENQKRP